MAKHLMFFQLREAMASPGCPVCRQADAAVDSAIGSLLHELVNDLAVRARLVESSGLCHEHAWRLVGHTDALGTALLHRELVVRLRGRVQAGPRSWAERGERGRRPCPMCETRDDSAGRAIETLLAHIGEEPLRDAFAASDGLCAAHFGRAMAVRGVRREVLEALSAAQDQCLQRLQWQLDELIRKFDYRFRQEARGDESTSWIRAVATISGLDVTRLPRARPASFPPPRKPPA